MANDGTINGTQTDWLAVTRAAVSDGREYFNSGIRREIEQDIRQFQGLHPQASKYLSDAYRTRSKFFRPKTRGTIRKNEAVAAASFFSNTDVVEITAWDDGDKLQVASASMLKELLNLRLKRSIPWFQTSIGAYQESMAVGMVCAHTYWKTDAKRGIDQPMIDLIPIENMVFSPSASWIDVVNTSPYIVRMIPMYVKDVKARMKATPQPDKTMGSKWLPMEDGQILAAVRHYSDSIRLQRESGRPDSQSTATALSPYQIVWVYQTIADVEGVDYIWYSLEDAGLLTKGKKLSEVFWHGLRPYVIGYSVIEAHKVYPPGVARLTRETQAELNENANQRMDNVKFAMNKRYFAKRGAQVDVRSLTRNVPSSVTLMNNVKEDVFVVETKDVTQSAFEEQDRLNADFDEIAGSFTAKGKADGEDLSNKVGGAELLTEDKNLVQGYQLRTFTETFIEPVMYQLMRLIQHYETDEDVLQLCAKKADIQQQGITDIDAALLMQDLSLSVHVGIGATSPRKQLENLLFALQKIKELLEGGELQQLGLDIEAMCNEVFGKLGYKNAERFFKWDDQDPNVVSLQNQVQQLTDELKNKKDPPEIVAGKVQLLQAQVKKTLADAFNVNVEGLFDSMQAGEVVAAVPAVGPVADTIAKAAGYEPSTPPGVDPGIYPGPATSAGDKAGAASAAGLSTQPVVNKRTGVGFSPGGGAAATAVQPGLPPGVPHNTDPLHPAKAASSDIGTHAGILGGHKSLQPV